MQVDYTGHFGNDLMTVDSARVSFNKKSSFIDIRQASVPEHRAGSDTATLYNAYIDQQRNRLVTSVLGFNDFKLIHYLATARPVHWAPFSHAQAQFRITVPVAIAAQLKRSVVGFALSEVSRRYVDAPPEFYIPTRWRSRPDKSIKQGSGTGEVTHIVVPIEWENPMIGDAPSLISIEYAKFLKYAENMYARMIKAGVAPEMARFVLPQSMYTSWIWTGSVYAWARVCKLRSTNGHAQEESAVIARQISDAMAEVFPATWQCLMLSNSVA